MKKAVFLDLGNVILKVNKDIASNKITKLLHIGFKEAKKNIDWELEVKYETGQVSTDEYIHQLNQKFPNRNNTKVFNYENLCNIWEQAFAEILETIKYLTELQKSVNLYMLSNTNEIHFHSINRPFNISRYFKKLILFYEVGLVKASKDIYQKALRICECQPGNPYFIDDLAENVESATNVDINAMVYKNNNSYEKFIIRYSLLQSNSRQIDT